MSEESQRPLIADSPLSVVLTAHNAAAVVEATLQEWDQFLTSLGRDYEILVVDDGSTDDTARKLNSFAADHLHIRLLCHEKHRGVGAALRTGLAAAGQPLLFYSACDRHYQPGDLRSLLKDIDQVDLVSGYRVCRLVPWWLRWLGRSYRLAIRVLFGVPLEPLPGWLGRRAHLYHWLVRAFFGVRIVDIDSEFKLFRKSIFARIPIQSDGPFVHAEILAKANFLGCLMTEAAISYEPSPHHEAAIPFQSVLAEAYRVFSRPDFGRSLPGRDAKEQPHVL